MATDLSLAAFVQALPKTETHLHLEGALPYGLLHEWDPARWPAQPAFRERNYRYANFPAFEQILLDHALPWFQSAERYHQAAKEIFATHVAQNVKYVETSFHLPVTGFIGVPGPEIIAAIRAAVPEGLEVRIFAGMLRSDISGPLRTTIDQLGSWDGLAGVDLHGFEEMPTEPDTGTVWQRLRDAGKVTKCHAGEFDGAHRVREAIVDLGVTRIQHGVRAIEDPAVVALAVERGVTFDICPISNIGLKVYSSLADHPLRRLLDAGVRCTISTDDPLSFANSINEEYLAISHALGFTRAGLARIARHGFEVASLADHEKHRWLQQLDRVIAEP
ncbi:MAG TPA: adenosine deaminase [Candidatus Didemnitutus sp.]|nr:adenosine deaminase [Candidatus Didemnitutus sp.]